MNSFGMHCDIDTSLSRSLISEFVPKFHLFRLTLLARVPFARRPKRPVSDFTPRRLNSCCRSDILGILRGENTPAHINLRRDDAQTAAKSPAVRHQCFLCHVVLAGLTKAYKSHRNLDEIARHHYSPFLTQGPIRATWHGRVVESMSEDLSQQNIFSISRSPPP